MSHLVLMHYGVLIVYIRFAFVAINAFVRIADETLSVPCPRYGIPSPISVNLNVGLIDTFLCSNPALFLHDHVSMAQRDGITGRRRTATSFFRFF